MRHFSHWGTFQPDKRDIKRRQLSTFGIYSDFLKKFRREYPEFLIVTISKKDYESLRKDIHTVGVSSVLICTANLENDLVYRITKTIYNNRENFAIHQLNKLSVETAFQGITIDIHPGSKRFFESLNFFEKHKNIFIICSFLLV